MSVNPVPRDAASAADAGKLVIGLVNLMPPPARRHTALNFSRMLQTAPHWPETKLRVFSIPAGGAGEACGSAGEAGAPQAEDIGALFSARIDGLIVTGTEPQAEAMEDEPTWPMLAKIIDWAGNYTVSSIFSCFAAHAAVYRMDKIRRHRLGEKLHGVFECGRAAEHSIIATAPAAWQVPHSRYNTLSEAALRDCGYTILSDAWRVGADSFTKQHRGSQFLMFQGHPEYAADTLLREYRRDLTRYPNPLQLDHPKMPHGYRDGALSPELDWAEPARRIGTSWLSYIAARKTARTDLAA